MRCFEGGAEQNVFFQEDASRVIKVTKPPFFGLRSFLEEYANNALWANFLFEDDIQFEGVLAIEEGVSVVISQPTIEGGPAAADQIAAWFEGQGYVPDGFYGWQHPDKEIRIKDAHPGNFVLMKNGLLVPIDLQILNPGKDYSEGQQK